jgi:hypothetical protein
MPPTASARWPRKLDQTSAEGVRVKSQPGVAARRPSPLPGPLSVGASRLPTCYKAVALSMVHKGLASIQILGEIQDCQVLMFPPACRDTGPPSRRVSCFWGSKSSVLSRSGVSR